MTIYSGKDLYKIKEGDIVRVTYESGNQSVFRVTEVGHNHQSIKGYNLNKYGQFGEGEEIGSLCKIVSVEIVETKEQKEEDKNITTQDVDLLLWVARNLSLIIDTIGEE